MLFSTAKAGDHVTWTIGRQGQKPDAYPARVVKGPHAGTDDLGRDGSIITIIALRTNLAGEPFLRMQNVLSDRFLFERTDIVPELDGTADEPKTIQALFREANEALLSFLNTQGEASDVAALAVDA